MVKSISSIFGAGLLLTSFYVLATIIYKPTTEINHQDEFNNESYNNPSAGKPLLEEHLLGTWLEKKIHRSSGCYSLLKITRDQDTEQLVIEGIAYYPSGRVINFVSQATTYNSQTRELEFTYTIDILGTNEIYGITNLQLDPVNINNNSTGSGYYADRQRTVDIEVVKLSKLFPTQQDQINYLADLEPSCEL